MSPDPWVISHTHALFMGCPQILLQMSWSDRKIEHIIDNVINEWVITHKIVQVGPTCFRVMFEDIPWIERAFILSGSDFQKVGPTVVSTPSTHGKHVGDRSAPDYMAKHSDTLKLYLEKKRLTPSPPSAISAVRIIVHNLNLTIWSPLNEYPAHLTNT